LKTTSWIEIESAANTINETPRTMSCGRCSTPLFKILSWLCAIDPERLPLAGKFENALKIERII
jgi:hypothetical protein